MNIIKIVHEIFGDDITCHIRCLKNDKTSIRLLGDWGYYDFPMPRTEAKLREELNFIRGFYKIKPKNRGKG